MAPRSAPRKANASANKLTTNPRMSWAFLRTVRPSHMKQNYIMQDSLEPASVGYAGFVGGQRVVRDAHLFVVGTLGVDIPQVVPLAEQVAHGQHGREHGVILVVVLMQAVAAHRLHIGEAG